MPVYEKRVITQPEIYIIGSKVNQLIYTLVCNYMPNIRILAKSVLHIFCSQGYSIHVQKKKGHNSRTRPVEEKGIRVRLFFMYMPHIKFQDSSLSGS